MTPLTAVVEASSPQEFERRRAERHPSNLGATTRPFDTEVTLGWGAAVRDISTSGIGLRLCNPFPAGTYLTVDLDLPPGQPTAPPLLARVVHSHDLADGTWHVGCEFVQPLSHSELEILV